MDGQHLAGTSRQASPVAIGLSGPAFLQNLMSSVASDTQSSGLNLIDIPLTLSAFNGYQPNISFRASDDLLVSSINLPLNGLPDASLYKMSDNSFLNTVDAMSKSDAKSPLNIMVASDGIPIPGQSSPAISSQANMSGSLQFHSVVSGGDKMLSAVNSLNFNDPEMLGDSAFDSASSSGLPQFDDGILSSLGSAGQGMRLGDGPSGTSFDLFDGGVTDSLSLSPQPFPDTGLMSDTSSSVLDTGLMQQQTDSILDNSSMKSTSKKNSGSALQNTDLSGQNKVGPSQCTVCGKTFNNIGALAKHRLTHSDERKYVCNVCSKGFKRPDHLNGHLMTHLDKKPYECQLPNCDKGYCDARSLRRHLESHHHLDPESIQTHVQASMAAAGISPPAPRNGSKKGGSEGRGKHLSSPVYSPGSATPTPSPGAAGAGNIFHFDAQQSKTSQQQKQQQELLVQKIHKKELLLLQQQKQQKEEKVKEQKASLQAGDSVSQQLQLQLQLHQKQSQQQQQPSADMLAVVQQLQQQIQQQQMDVQKKKVAAEKETAGAQSDSSVSWQDKAGVYTFVGTPTSSEPSPASRSDQSPSGVVAASELPAHSPVSPATVQPISPLTTNPSGRAVWYNSSPDTPATTKIEEAPKNQAYCVTCDRYFKNAAALNGHMRCHGGFLKKGKDKDGKKSPMRKSSNASSSDMGPPLRRPPHTSTPSPQPSISRTSPTTPTAITFSPAGLAPVTPGQAAVDQHSAIDVLNVGSPSDQLMPNKHKHLQEQLSTHILKRRMSGEQQQQQQQQRGGTQKGMQSQPQQPHQQQQQLHPNQEQMRLLEHITAHHQLQEPTQQNIQQLLSSQSLGDGSAVPINLDSIPTRTASPHQGEHIQRLVQSFQQVEELQRQQQQQSELPQLSAEQLEQIRQQHKLLGLPPLNPHQLQYQLQEQQNQLLQAQIREQQLQEQQQQQHLQGLDQGALVMATPSIAQQELLQQLGGNTQITSAGSVSMAAVSSQPMSVSPQQQTLVQLSSQPTEAVESRSSISSQMALNTSVQQILAALDPAVVSAAGLNLSDHQHLLAQLQKQQQAQQLQQQQQHDAIDIQDQSPLATMGISAGQSSLVGSQLSNLHVSQIPQILLQPPDSDDMNGVPTLSIPESVVLGGDSSSILQQHNLETEQEQIERIQNGLMASVHKQQHDPMEAALNHPSMTHTLASGPLGHTNLDQGGIPNFLNIQAPPNQIQSALISKANLGQLRESSAQGSTSSINSSSNSIQQDPSTFLSNMSSSNSSSLTSPATSSAIARNTDAAVAQILKNISNSMAESSGGGLLAHSDNSDLASSSPASRGMITGSSLDNNADRSTSYQSFQTYPSSFSKPFKDSIKQDVMLSSTVDSDSNQFSSDPLARDDVPYAPKPTKLQHNGQSNKRRLSADLESHHRSSSFSSFSKSSHSQGVNPHTVLVNPLEVEGISSGRIRVRSKSGDINYKYMRSKSVDHSPMRPRSFTEDSLHRSNRRLEETFIKGGRGHHQDQELFTRSDGAGVFRNPSSLPSPLKIKRKHRPAPLYIPPQFGIFQSRLRSPRVISKDGHHLSSERGRGHTPPPYTPPPMLSPFRSGSGLFCTLQSAQPHTPRSAPVSGKILLSHRGSIGSAKAEGSDIFSDPIPEEEAAPETDTEAHINVGPEYQAVLPGLRDKTRAYLYTPADSRENLLWHPASEGDNSDSQLQVYQEFACSAAIRGNGCNVEYGLHLLHMAKGDVSDAMLQLMAEPPDLPIGHPMLDYKYQESDTWNSNEMERFYKSIMIHDKDFFKLSKDVGTKTVKQCIQFYYVWKKVCPDDYKRLRQARSKQGDYNTRRQAERAAAQEKAEKAAQAVVAEIQQTQPNNLGVPEPMEENAESVDSDNTSCLSDGSNAPDSVQSTAPNTANSTPTRGESPTPLPPPQFHCTHEGCSAKCSSKQSLKRHMRKHTEKPQSSPSAPRKPRPSTPSRSPVYDQSGEEIFPCRLCGRVFAKVKSRSAHMKSHKIAEQAQQEKKAAELSNSFGAT